VAQYYFSRGAYIAAINRAQSALSDFRDVPALEEALFILVKSYEALDLPQLRDDAKRVLVQNYPNSDYITQGFKAKSNPWWKLW
jgi:outer membrane protein assembly factor BamD